MNVRRSGEKLNWRTYLAGFLVMSWGSTIMTHLMLQLPIPVLYNINPYINYLTVHLLLTAAFHYFPDALNLPLLDLILWPLDGLLRVNSVSTTLSHVVPTAANTVNPHLKTSPFFHMLLGAAASAGGGFVAGTFNVWSPNWGFSTPVYLRDNVGFWAMLDGWGGVLVAVVYSAMTAHPAFAGVTSVLPKEFILSPLGAKALCTLLLGSLYGIRVLCISPLIRGPMPPVPSSVSTNEVHEVQEYKPGAGGRNRRSRPMQKAGLAVASPSQ